MNYSFRISSLKCFTILKFIQQRKMRIIDPFYLITLIPIILINPLLIYLKLSTTPPLPLAITIYGGNIESAMLVYYIDQYVKEERKLTGNEIIVNITVVDVGYQDKSDMQEKKKQLTKKIFTFCPVEKQFVKMISNLNMKYRVKEYGIYYGQQSEESAKITPYKLVQSSKIENILKYGLSHYTANSLFMGFANKLNRTSPSKNSIVLSQLSMKSILKQLSLIDLPEEGLKYLSSNIGLDQKYIKDYLYPVILGSYLHEPTALASMLKLLPVYCNQNSAIGRSLILFQEEEVILQKLWESAEVVNLKFLHGYTMESYENDQKGEKGEKGHVRPLNAHFYKTPLQSEIKKGTQKVSSSQEFQIFRFQNTSLPLTLQTDMLFIFDDSDQPNSRLISYYKTLVDGLIIGDQKYEEMYTMYLKTQENRKEDQDAKKNKEKEKKKGVSPIYSITRICAENCKHYQQSAYILISKHKLSEKDLTMFHSQRIVASKRFYIQKTSQPLSKKFQDAKNVFRIYDTETLSDSYEIKLHLGKLLARIVRQKIKTHS